jgi:hypothetical protein
MLNTVEPLTAFQLEVCGNRYTPQNVIVVVMIAGVVRPKFRRPLQCFPAVSQLLNFVGLLIFYNLDRLRSNSA